MDVTEFLEQVNYAYRGTDDDAPTPTDDDGKQWISMLNRKKSRMYRDKTKNWASAYAEREVGTVAAGANSFDFDDDGTDESLAQFITPARQVYVTDADGQRHYFDVVKVQKINPSQQAVYFSGHNPQTLNFTKSVNDDEKIVGGAVTVPGYWEPLDIDVTDEDVATQLVPVDDPYWAVMSVAATLAQNDTTYEDKFPDLQNEANDLYKQMTIANRRNPYGQPDKAATRTYRIRSPR